jgi:hypothetical protein
VLALPSRCFRQLHRLYVLAVCTALDAQMTVQHREVYTDTNSWHVAVGHELAHEWLSVCT